MNLVNDPGLPLHLRRLKADMALKGLSLTDITIKTRIPYLMVSRVINGRVERPELLQRIQEAIKAAPMPEHQAA